jgi:hypothetical protein
LRKKIEPEPAHPKYIVTEPWLGYRFVTTQEAPDPSAALPQERNYTEDEAHDKGK